MHFPGLVDDVVVGLEYGIDNEERASCVLQLPDGPETSVTTPGHSPNLTMLGVPLLLLPLLVYVLVLDIYNRFCL